MAVVNERDIYEQKPWLNDDVQNVERLSEIVGGGGGSSDFSTAQVTVTFTFDPVTSDKTETRAFSSQFPVLRDDGIYADYGAQVNLEIGETSKSIEIDVPLYKGSTVTGAYINLTKAQISGAPALTGNISLSQDNMYIIITGDGEITAPVTLDSMS